MIGGILGFLVPRWRIIPAVRPEFMSSDAAVVRKAQGSTSTLTLTLFPVFAPLPNPDRNGANIPEPHP